MGDLWAKIDDHPPSSKLVVKTLKHEGEMTERELRCSTRLPGRTLRNAISRLDDAGVVERRENPKDARSTIYSLKDDDTPANPF